MGKQVLMNGNEALAEGAIRGGCQAYFGYPITPQNELIEYMSEQMPQRGRVFIQAESEISSISMVHGAAATGTRAMTSSSSPGVSLMMEGISYLGGCGLPAVLVNVQRAGPGLGGIAPAQADYFQSVKGGWHGDYHMIVLAPNSVQEMHDFAHQAFALAEKYRILVMILADGQLGQMMEPLELRPEVGPAPDKDWALTGAKDRPRRIIRSYWAKNDDVEANNRRIQDRLQRIRQNEVRFEKLNLDDAQVMLVGFGSSARLCQGAIDELRQQGLRAGLFRPITLWPFPSDALAACASKVKNILVVELNAGQMIEDVRLAVGKQIPIHFLGRSGGNVMSVSDIAAEVRSLARGNQ